MLVLSRKPLEAIRLSGGITISVVSIRGECVKLGIDAPRDCRVLRSEVFATLSAEEQATFAAEQAVQ